jgi:hypothetical protein
MINFKFGITNPWWDRFKTIYNTAGDTPFKHKFWEVQVIESDDIIMFDLRITTRCDHAGTDLWLGLLGYSINLNFYDNRHWNHEASRYYQYDEENGWK